MKSLLEEELGNGTRARIREPGAARIEAGFRR
jgi:hypothetical protein